MELFIYYRVAKPDEACKAVMAAQHHLTATHARALRAACFIRWDARGATLMETYAHDDPGLTAEMVALIDASVAAAVAPWREGERRVEWFERVSAGSLPLAQCPSKRPL